MRHDMTDRVFDSDLPLVRRHLPWPVRVLLGIGGVAALVWPAWDWWHFLRQPSVLTVFPWIMVVLIGSVGVGLLRAVFSGGSDTWRYPAGAVEIHRRHWGREEVIRLTDGTVADVEVRHSDLADPDVAWYVVVVPKPTYSHLALAAGAKGFHTDGYASRRYAERVRQALLAHLGRRA
ncbi:MAG: hypothetical protein ABW163_11960 [Luteimonas sp.]